MTRRKMLMGICILCFFLLAGWIFATVEIKTRNGEPLIDLDELLAGGELGQPGSENQGSLGDPSEGNQNGDGSQCTPSTERKLSIIVCDKSVSCQGKTYSYDRTSDEVEGMEEILKNVGDGKVILQDYYAEAHAYKCVLKNLQETVQDDSRIVMKTLGSMEEAEDE